MYDDIPEARRQPVPKTSSSQLTPIIWMGGGVGLGVLAVGAWIAIDFSRSQSYQSPRDSQAVSSSPVMAPVATPPQAAETTLGHYAYEVAPRNELEPITADNQIRLRNAAARAYQKMAAAAAQDGVTLLPISGFRTIEDQNHLFFRVKEERVQGAQQRAKVSAPPGRSEHHTGYAIDIGDADQPHVHLSTAFENTSAFAWLQKNAPRYSFELSFPEGNPQGVSYEPWHWRFVGDQDSLETFYNARE